MTADGVGAGHAVLGYAAFAVAVLALLISLAALLQSFARRRYSSGLPIVPTICAIVGVSAGGWSWTRFAVVVALDLAGLLAAFAKPRDERR